MKEEKEDSTDNQNCQFGAVRKLLRLGLNA
jgi:hypothetical protein